MRLRNARRRGAMDEQALLSGAAIRTLGDADERDFIVEAELDEHFVHLGDLTEAAVDQQQIRRRNLTVADARVATLQRLTQRPILISRRDTRDVETPILLLQRPFRPEDH